MLVTSPSYGKTVICSSLWDQSNSMNDYGKDFKGELLAEWKYAQDFFKAESVNVEINRTSYLVSADGREVKISTEGKHPLNQFARDVYEAHKADVVYIPGNLDPIFTPVIVKNEVTGLKILLPLDVLTLPFNLARTFPALHELRHLTDYTSIFEGRDTAFLGRVTSLKKGTEIPGKIKENSFGYETSFGFNELRTFFSQLHQQTLRLSLRLKQGNMSEIEIKERALSVQDTLTSLQLLTDRTSRTLDVLLKESKSAEYTQENIKYRDVSITTVTIIFTVDGVPLKISAPLPAAKTGDNFNQLALDHLKWTLSAANLLTAAMAPAVSASSKVDANNIDISKLKSFVETILEDLRPAIIHPFYKK